MNVAFNTLHGLHHKEQSKIRDTKGIIVSEESALLTHWTLAITIFIMSGQRYELTPLQVGGECDTTTHLSLVYKAFLTYTMVRKRVWLVKTPYLSVYI